MQPSPTSAPTPHYLTPLLAEPHTVARFITHLPDITVTTDRAEMLKRLEPFHRHYITEQGLKWNNFRRAEQVHGNRVALVGDIGSNYPVSGVDGLICSGISDALMGVYVADCAAVWIYDAATQAKALVHSGKKGTEKNIVSVAIKAMARFFKSQPGDMTAVISPCIRPPHYEIDIASLIASQLRDAGLDPTRIHDSGIDTASDLDTYYSYRVEKGNTGRMLALFGRMPMLEKYNCHQQHT